MTGETKTVSFRVSGETFDELQQIIDGRDSSLSSVFQEYVDVLVTHQGQIELVPEYAHDTDIALPTDFSARVEISKRLVREHERLELECTHLREQLEEHQSMIERLELELEEHQDASDERIYLEDIDANSHSK